jgi:hypothetical protein
MYPTITDPTGPRDPSAFEAMVEPFFLPYMVDARDVVFVRLALGIFTQLLPFTLLMWFLPTLWTLALGIPYIAYAFIRFGGPTILALHAVSHRPLFKKRHRKWNKVITHVLPLFFGFPTFAYNAHHVVMHHKMENSSDDLSSTAAYQRDNPLHFLHYWARFTFFGYLHLGSWLLRGGKGEMLRPIVIGDLAIHAVMLTGLWFNPAAAAFTFWIPYTMLKFFLMAGNWSEHAFVDSNAPAHAMTNSTNLLNTPYNHRAFNAGYHLVHHLVPGLHWADTVPWFQKHFQKMVDEDAIFFDGVRNNQQIWWCLMRGDYVFLADHMMDPAGRRPSRDERIAFLKSRVQGQAGAIKGLASLVERRA